MVTAPKTSQSTNMVSTVKVGTVIRSVCVSHNTAPSGTAYIAMVTARCQPDGPVTAGTLQNFEFNRYKTLENDFLEGALGKAGLLSARR